MPTAAPPPRITVLLAREATTAIVLRRGPSHVVGTFGWDRATDTISPGQWLKGRIYEDRCDLSPDGKYFLYFALNGKRHSETRGTWSAVSFAPYLKALVLWGKGVAWGGGGVFLDNRRYWLRRGAEDHFLVRTTSYANKLQLVDDEAAEEIEPGVTAAYGNLARENWKNWEKPLPQGWRLRRLRGAGGPTLTDFTRQGTLHDEYALVPPDGEPLSRADWSWADWDRVRERLVWASEGKLLAASLTGEGLAPPQVLYDFGDETFEPIKAPY